MSRVSSPSLVETEAGVREAEIEITPEKMEAGPKELAPFSFGDRSEWIVSAAYRAMATAARAGLERHESPRPRLCA